MKEKAMQMYLTAIETNEAALRAISELVHNANKALKDIVSSIPAAEKLAVPEYLTYDEAAKFLNMPKGTLYQKVHKREIPFYGKGRSIRFRLSDLTVYMESRRVYTDEELRRHGPPVDWPAH